MSGTIDGDEHDPEAHLAAVLTVEAEGDHFLGRAPAQVFDRIYGGQLAAQALLAAAGTVGPDFDPISAHVNFLKLGSARQPVRYDVERVADGRRLATRVVHAGQGDAVLSVVSVSFQARSSEHELLDWDPPAPPPVPRPESLPTRAESMQARYGDEVTRQMGLTSWPIDTRYIDRPPWAEGTAAPRNRLWMRSRVTLPTDRLTQRAALLYAGDLHMFEPTLFPGQVSWHRLVNRDGFFGASLDYIMWFHREFRVDEWLLHEQDAPAIAASRGLTMGHFWSADGRLVASVAEQAAVFRDVRG